MKRELNDMEYMNYSMGQPYNLAVVIRIMGNLTEESLKSVFVKLQIRHPLLKVRIEHDDKDIPWLTSENVEAIPITVVKRLDEAHTRREFQKHLVTPFDYEKKEQPLFRITLLSSNQNSDLVLCAQHTITDGMSMVFLVRDLMKYLNYPKEKIDVLDAPANTQDIFSKKIRRTISKTSFRAKILIILLRIYHAFLFGVGKGKKKIEETMESKHVDLQIHSWNFSEEQTKSFLKKCKTRRISVHSAICTAFLPEISTINNPVDLRNRLNFPIGESFGLFAGGTVISMKYRNKKDFWSNAQRYQRKLIWNLRDRKVFGIHRAFNKSVSLSDMSKLGILLVDILSRENPFAITNLLDLDRLGLTLEAENFSIESFYGAISNALDAMTVVVFTLRKKMYFHYIYMETHHEIDRIKQISENVIKTLLES